MINNNTLEILKQFEAINTIPRCSGNELEVSNYLKKFGEDLGLEVVQDELLNIIIKKPGTSGYENSPTVILQGHMDMVCEKTSSSNHDFSKDPIEMTIDRDYLRANNTTLGADNGIAVAISMAILESNNISHPPLEVLVTTNEETNMMGALGLSSEVLNGKMMINIDSEDEGVITLGSAGGVTIYITRQITKEQNNWNSYEINFKGLNGGHSGMEIDKPLGNMVKIIGEFLDLLKNESKFKIGEITSGTVDNAIPRSGKVLLGIKEDMNNSLENIKSIVLENNKNLEGNLEITITPIKLDETFSEELSYDISKLLNELPTGVNSYIKDSHTVESSNNLALIRETDNEIYIAVSIRSSNDKKKEELLNKSLEIIKENNFNYSLGSKYPMWEYKEISRLRDISMKAYKDMTGKDMKIEVIHAGLECGAILEKYPEMDVISIGPNIYNVHTPDEKLDLNSLSRFYDYMLEILKNIK